MMSKRSIGFAILILVILFQVLRFVSVSYANGSPYGLHAFFKPKPASLTHPIPKLMADAEVKYRALLARQSRSLGDAAAEYRRRYKREPPKGFDDWYAFATANNVKIIDEYDGMVDDLLPFWNLSGEEIRRRVLQVGSLPSVDLVRLRNGTSTTLNIEKGFHDDEVKLARVGGPRAKGFRVMMEKFQDKLPDLDFPINAKAEGRILVPWEHKLFPNMSQQDSSGGVESMLGGPFIPDWRGDGNVWEAYRRTCHPSSQARRLFGSIRGQAALSTTGQAPHSYLRRLEAASSSSFTPSPGSDFIFAERPDDNYDFCSNPWARYQQGNFFSDWRTIPVLYPIFSPGKVRGFSDIQIPSHYYYSSTSEYTYGWDPEKLIINDVDVNEVRWEEKSDMIFWRGSTTGGGSSPPGFLMSFQRHRFLELTTTLTNATRPVVFADPPGSQNYVTVEVPVHEMNEDFMDTAFTRAVGCDEFPGGCEGMMRHYRFDHPLPLSEHWKHKYLVDFDGMGYSARAMAFLASESVMIKSTVYREFFSDWIQPWLHYIPLSQSYNEIYNIHAFFSGPSPAMVEAANSSTLIGRPASTDGDKRLRRIASAGREWKRSVGRKVDMETYVYRLCLEYARLYADDRDAMSYKS